MTFQDLMAGREGEGGRIGETPEADRCAEFLRDSSPTAYDTLLADA